MRQLGVRLGIGLVVALIATGATLGAPAYARSHRHHHHHHHGAVGTPGGAGAPAVLCSSAPNPAVLDLAGNVAVSVTCHGLSFVEPVTVDSLLVRGNCATTNLPLAATADALGDASFNIVGAGCLPGTYGVQLVGAITTTEFPVAFTF